MEKPLPKSVDIRIFGTGYIVKLDAQVSFCSEPERLAKDLSPYLRQELVSVPTLFGFC